MLVLDARLRGSGHSAAQGKTPEEKKEEIFNPYNQAHLRALDAGLSSILNNPNASENLKGWARSVRAETFFPAFWHDIANGTRSVIPGSMTFQDDIAVRAAFKEVPGFIVVPVKEFTAGGSLSIECKYARDNASWRQMYNNPLPTLLTSASVPLVIKIKDEHSLMGRLSQEDKEFLTGAKGLHAQILEITPGSGKNTAYVTLRVPQENFSKYQSELEGPTFTQAGAAKPAFEIITIERRLVVAPPPARKPSELERRTVQQADATFSAPPYVFDQYGEMIPRPRYDNEALFVLDFILPISSVKNVADKISAGQTPSLDDLLWLAVDGVFTFVQAKAIFKAGKFAVLCTELVGKDFEGQLSRRIMGEFAMDAAKQRYAMRYAYRYMATNAEKLTGKSVDEVVEAVAKEATKKAAKYSTIEAGRLRRILTGAKEGTRVATAAQNLKSGIWGGIQLSIGYETYDRLADAYELAASKDLPSWVYQKYPQLKDVSPEEAREIAFRANKRELASFWALFEAFGVGMKAIERSAPYIANGYVRALRSLAKGEDEAKVIARYADELKKVEGMTEETAQALAKRGLELERGRLLPRLAKILDNEAAAEIVVKSILSAVAGSAIFPASVEVDKSILVLTAAEANAAIARDVTGAYGDVAAMDRSGKPIQDRSAGEKNALASFTDTYVPQGMESKIEVSIVLAAGGLFALYPSEEDANYFNSAGITQGRYNNFVLASSQLGTLEEKDFSTLRRMIVEHYDAAALSSFIGRFENKPAELWATLDATAQRWLNVPGAMELDLKDNPAKEMIMQRWKERVLSAQNTYSQQKVGGQTLEANPRIASALALISGLALQGYLGPDVLRPPGILYSPPMGDFFGKTVSTSSSLATRASPVSVSSRRDKATGEWNSEARVSLAGFGNNEVEAAARIMMSFPLSGMYAGSYLSQGMEDLAAANAAIFAVSGLAFMVGASKRVDLMLHFKGGAPINSAQIADMVQGAIKSQQNAASAASRANALTLQRIANENIGAVSGGISSQALSESDFLKTAQQSKLRLGGRETLDQIFSRLDGFEGRLNTAMAPYRRTGTASFQFKKERFTRAISELLDSKQYTPENFTSLLNREVRAQIGEYLRKFSETQGVIPNADLILTRAPQFSTKDFFTVSTKQMVRSDAAEIMRQRAAEIEARVRQLSGTLTEGGRLSQAGFSLNIDAKSLVSKYGADPQALANAFNVEVNSQVSAYLRANSVLPREMANAAEFFRKFPQERYAEELSRLIRERYLRGKRTSFFASEIAEMKRRAYYNVSPELRKTYRSFEDFSKVAGELMQEYSRPLSIEGRFARTARRFGAGFGAATMVAAPLIYFGLPYIYGMFSSPEAVFPTPAGSEAPKASASAISELPYSYNPSLATGQLIDLVARSQPLLYYYRSRPKEDAAMCASFVKYLFHGYLNMNSKVSPLYQNFGSPWDFDRKMSERNFAISRLSQNATTLERQLLAIQPGSFITVKYRRTSHTSEPVSHTMFALGDGKFAHYLKGEMLVMDLVGKRLLRAEGGALVPFESENSPGGYYDINAFLSEFSITKKSSVYVPILSSFPTGSFATFRSSVSLGRKVSAFEFAKWLSDNRGVPFETALEAIVDQNSIAPREAPWGNQYSFEVKIPVQKIELPKMEFYYPDMSPAIKRSLDRMEKGSQRYLETIEFGKRLWSDYSQEAGKVMEIAKNAGYEDVAKELTLVLYGEQYQSTDSIRAFYNPKSIAEKMAVGSETTHAITSLRQLHSFGRLQNQDRNIDEYISSMNQYGQQEGSPWAKIRQTFFQFASPRAMAAVLNWDGLTPSERYDAAAVEVTGTDLEAQVLIAAHYLRQNKQNIQNDATRAGVQARPEDIEISTAFSHSRGYGGEVFATFQQNLLRSLQDNDLMQYIKDELIIDGKCGDKTVIAFQVFCGFRGITVLPGQEALAVDSLEPKSLEAYFKKPENVAAIFQPMLGPNFMPCLNMEYLSSSGKQHCTPMTRQFMDFYRKAR